MLITALGHAHYILRLMDPDAGFYNSAKRIIKDAGSLISEKGKK